MGIVSAHRRLACWLVATTMLAVPIARAQDGAAPGDPPARVGRLARLLGSVSTHGAGATQWSPAVLNFPFVSGDALWTEPQAQADIEIGPSLATLADSTEFDLSTLDDHTLIAAEPQGAVFLDLRDVQPGDTYTINTPRGAVQIAAAGEYEILAGDSSTPTRVVVVRGAAQLTSGTLALRASQGQMVVATGDADVGGDVEAVRSYDPFLTAMLARRSVPPGEPQAVQGMTGAEGLAQYGSWQQDPDYGAVWYPQVASDWVPYRDGSWSYVAPWGWTWVDSEPWGFAPFHYGRWAELHRRWCWVPGRAGTVPAYAPALVGFFAAGAAIGWVPLGPREPYVPPYGGSRRYLSRLNYGDDRGQRAGMDHGAGLLNRHAMTIAPAAALVRSQQIRPVAKGIDTPEARGLSMAGVRGPLPVRPGFAGRPIQPRAPGPAIDSAALHRAAMPGGRIPFRQATVPAAIRVLRPPEAGPAQPGREVPGPQRQPSPHPAILRPIEPAMPALRPAVPGRPPGYEPTQRFAPARPAAPRMEPRPPMLQPGPPRAMLLRPALPGPMSRHQPIAPRVLAAPHAAAPPGAAIGGRPTHP